MISATRRSLGSFSLLPADEPRPPRATDGEVLTHERVGDLHRLIVGGPGIGAGSRPGQFAMVTIPTGRGQHTLPRPMALYAWEQDSITIVYRVAGVGTEDLARISPGYRLTVVSPLGRPFAMPPQDGGVVLLGRGIGSCSLLALARQLASSGHQVTAVLSGRSTNAVVPRDDFAEAGCARVLVATDADGTSDLDLVEAALTKRLSAPPSAIYCCGASRFLDLAAALAQPGFTDIQVSIEAHMACGLGYCHGCATPLTRVEEAPLVCRDGPCFRWYPRTLDRGGNLTRGGEHRLVEK